MPNPRRRKHAKAGIRQDGPVRCRAHLQWVRGFECAVGDRHENETTVLCDGTIEAAHVRNGTDGAMGMKPGDNWTVPLCEAHHRHQHTIGEPEFDRRYRIDRKALAATLWHRSPHGRKYRMERNDG